MNTYAHWYLTDFFLEWEMFQLKAVEEIKTHIMFSNVLPKIVLGGTTWKNMKQLDRPQMTV